MAPLRSSCSTLDCRARAQPSSFPEEEALHTRREEGEEVQEEFHRRPTTREDIAGAEPGREEQEEVRRGAPQEQESHEVQQ